MSNARIFDEPIYNYTRDFPFLFEELVLPVSYKADRRKAASVLLGVARRHTVETSQIGDEALEEMRRRYFMERGSPEPRVYWRLTDNWPELTVRFVTREHGVRDVKDRMSREILQGLDEAGIDMVSPSFEIARLPAVQVSLANSNGTPERGGNIPGREHS